MTCHRVLGSVAVGLIVFTGGRAAPAAQTATATAKGATDGAAAAAKASPELVSALSKELGSSPEQAAGAAGALFAVAKSRLNADEFGQVAKAVPGMNTLLAAAPAPGGAAGGMAAAPGAAAGGIAGAASKVAGTSGSASGLATAATAFSKLGLQPDQVAKAVPVLTSFVTKSGGAAVGGLLGGALK